MNQPHEPILQVTAPRVTRVQRASENLVTPGDRAACRLEPGIFALLMNPIGGSRLPVGKDLHPMSTVPTGIAIDAAVEACGEATTGVSILRAMNLSLEGPVSCRDPLVATAEVSKVGRRSVTVAVRVVEEGSDRLILQGDVVLVRVVDGRAGLVPTSSVLSQA